MDSYQSLISRVYLCVPKNAPPPDEHSTFWSEIFCVTCSRPILFIINFVATMIYFSQGHFVKRGDG